MRHSHLVKQLRERRAFVMGTVAQARDRQTQPTRNFVGRPVPRRFVRKDIPDAARHRTITWRASPSAFQFDPPNHLKHVVDGDNVRQFLVLVDRRHGLLQRLAKPRFGDIDGMGQPLRRRHFIGQRPPRLNCRIQGQHMRNIRAVVICPVCQVKRHPAWNHDHLSLADAGVCAIPTEFDGTMTKADNCGTEEKDLRQ